MSEYTPTTDEVREDFAYPWEGFKQNREGRLAAFDRWHAVELRHAKAEAWDKGYRQGIDDERTAEALQVGIGLGGYATANRSNPYREATDD